MSASQRYKNPTCMEKIEMDKVVRIELEGGYVPTNRYNTTSATTDTAKTSAEMPPNSVLRQDIQTGEGFYDTVQIIHHFPPRTMPHELSPRCASRLPPTTNELFNMLGPWPYPFRPPRLQTE